jgi:hypothetical protein
MFACLISAIALLFRGYLILLIALDSLLKLTSNPEQFLGLLLEGRETRRRT